jgi:hypothetical protein
LTGSKPQEGQRTLTKDSRELPEGPAAHESMAFKPKQ